MINIAIICPVHNRIDITKEGLLSVKNAIRLYEEAGELKCKFTIVVVDDGSTDGTYEWLQINMPDIKLLKGDGNLWWSGAVNLAAKYSIDVIHSDWLLLWNDDIIPDEDYFVALERIILKDQNHNSIYGSLILDNITGKVWSAGGYFRKYTGIIGQYTSYEAAEKLKSCDWLPGMGTLVPTSILNDRKLMWNDRDFPQYQGDSDFTLRCKREGLSIFTATELVIYNKTEATGFTRKRNVSDIVTGLTSIRSDYNFQKNLLFFSIHGIIPTGYFGMFKKYFFYFGGFLKHYIKGKFVRSYSLN